MTETREPPTGPNQVEDLLARRGHLDDGGFTDRVMGALPPSRSRWWWLPLALGAAAASAVAAWVLPGVLEAATVALRAWRPGQAAFPGPLLAGAAAVAAVVFGWLSLALGE